MAWVDALVRASPLTSAESRRAGVAAVGLPGIGRARRELRAVRDGVDRPKETELRLLVVRLGFPEPQVQCPVRGLGWRVIQIDQWGLTHPGSWIRQLSTLVPRR